MALAKKIFNEAKAERERCLSLNGGLYKLREAADRLHRDSLNIDELIAYRKDRIKPPVFIACSWEDRRLWLKGALLDIPRRLGGEVVPSVMALRADGLPAAKVAELQTWVSSRCEALVRQCDQICALLARSMKPEYELWNDGESMIRDLLDRVVNFIDDIIRYVDEHRPLHGVSEQIENASVSGHYETTMGSKACRCLM
jgi:hypothetical protein